MPGPGWLLQPEGNRAIIREPYLHVRSEPPPLQTSRPQTGLTKRYEVIEECFPHFRVRCAAETGPSALPGVSHERELGYNQQATAAILQTEIHTIPGVSEDTIVKDPIQQMSSLLNGVASLDPKKNQ